MKFVLPYPPSVNHYWRNYRGRMVISKKGREYRKQVCAMLTPADGNGIRKPPAGGRIALAMDAFPPDRRRRDLDNANKAVWDSLEHAGVYENDGQIDLALSVRQSPLPGGQVVIRIVELPLHTCLLCGRPMPPDYPKGLHHDN